MGGLGFILGLLIAVSLSVFITGLLLKKSNDFGDSTGSYNHFAEGSIRYYVKENNYHRQELKLSNDFIAFQDIY